jgi:hypothetical protein
MDDSLFGYFLPSRAHLFEEEAMNANRAATRFIVLAVALLSIVPADACTQERQRIVNQVLGFSFECPADWSVQRTHISDPAPDIEAFKSGKVGIGFTIGKQEEGEHNGVRLNAVKPFEEGVLAPPTIEVSAHPWPAKTCDQFSIEVKQWMQLFDQKLVSERSVTTANKLEGCEFIYSTKVGGREVFSRMVVLFTSGKRFVLSYFERDKKDFDNNAPLFEDVLHSFMVIPAPSK